MNRREIPAEIEDYREPSVDGYRQKQTYKTGQSFNLVAFPDIEVRVSDLLPPTQKARQVMKGRRNGKAVKLRGRKTKPSL